jgi:hypothetical protein
MSKRKTLASDTYSSSESEDNDTEPPSDRDIEPLTEEADKSDSENRDDPLFYLKLCQSPP